MKHLGGEVTTESTPCWSIKSGADVVLVAGHEFVSGKCFWTIRENGGVLNESVVGQSTIGYENGRSRTDIKIDDRTMFGMERFKKRFELGE